MNIIRKINKGSTFSDIMVGNCFEYIDKIYLKVAPFDFQNACTNGKTRLNAVNLTDNCISSFDDGIGVRSLNMRIEEV